MDWGKSWKPSVRILIILAEIRTGHLPSTNVKCYQFNQLAQFLLDYRQLCRDYVIWNVTPINLVEVQYRSCKYEWTSARLHGVTFQKTIVFHSDCCQNLRPNILSCVWVNIDGFWIGNWIYWTLTNKYSAVPNSPQQSLSLLSLLGLCEVLSVNGIQQWTFPFLWVSELSPAPATGFSQ
jgi:hypothetical protein